MRPLAVLLLALALCPGCASSRSGADFYRGLEREQSRIVEIEGTHARIYLSRETLPGSSASIPTLYVVTPDSIPQGETLEIAGSRLSGAGSRNGSAAYPLPHAIEQELRDTYSDRVPIDVRTDSGELAGAIRGRDWDSLRRFLDGPDVGPDGPRRSKGGIFAGALIAGAGVLGFLGTRAQIDELDEIPGPSDTGALQRQMLGWMLVTGGGCVLAMTSGN